MEEAATAAGKSGQAMEASSVLAPLLSGEHPQVLLSYSIESHFVEAVTILANCSDCSQHRRHVAAAAAQSSAADMAPASYESLLHHPTKATKKVLLAARSVNTYLLCWLAQS